MTLFGSGLPYVVAVAAVARMGRRLGLSPQLTLALTASFAFATFASAYTRHLNVNIMLLAVACLVFLLLVESSQQAAPPIGKLLLLGLLNGCGYAIEQPTGGLLLVGTGLVLLVRWPHLSTALLYGSAALPGPILHHAVNYWVAGTLRPLGQVPEYFDYEGSNFNAKTLTGFWNHDGVGAFLWYAVRLIYSERGFLPANVPLFLLVPGVVILLRRSSGGRRLWLWSAAARRRFGSLDRETIIQSASSGLTPRIQSGVEPPHSIAKAAYPHSPTLLLWPLSAERPEMWLALLWPASVWLVYAALSTNYAGFSCGIRWFVPFLAAGYYLLALLLRERPDLTTDFLLLSGCGVILAAEMWWEGPWAYTWYSYWPVQVLALLSWATYRWRRYQAAQMQLSLSAAKHVSA